MAKLENDLTADYILTPIRRDHPEWMTLKHADMFTKGIPDLSISNRSCVSVWFEVKRLKKPNQRILEPRTWVDNLAQLDLTTRLGGWVVAFDQTIPGHPVLVAPAEDVWKVRHEGLLSLSTGDVMVITQPKLATLISKICSSKFNLAENHNP